MLKPALARGELHCIGATTLDEYRKYIEKDAALERRFQKVLVDEPSVEDTIAILRGSAGEVRGPSRRRDHRPGDRRCGGALASLHHRSLPAGQGHRPDRRGRRAHQDGDRLQAGGDGQARAADDPAEDRARGREEGKGRSLPQAPGPDRGRDRQARARVRRPGRDLEGREGPGPGYAAHQGRDRAGEGRDGGRQAQGRLAEGLRAAVRAPAAAGGAAQEGRDLGQRARTSTRWCARRSAPRRSPRSSRA